MYSGSMNRSVVSSSSSEDNGSEASYATSSTRSSVRVPKLRTGKGPVPTPALPVFGAWNFQSPQTPEEAAAAAAAASAAARLRSAPSAQAWEPESAGSGGVGFTAMFANKGKERRAMRIVDGRIMEVPSDRSQASISVSPSRSSHSPDSRSPTHLAHLPPHHPLYHSPLSGLPNRAPEPYSQPQQPYLPGPGLAPIISESLSQSSFDSSRSSSAPDCEDNASSSVHSGGAPMDSALPAAPVGGAAGVPTAGSAATAALVAMAAQRASPPLAASPAPAAAPAPAQAAAASDPPSLAELQSLRLRLAAGENLSPAEMQRLTQGILALMTAPPAAPPAAPAAEPVSAFLVPAAAPAVARAETSSKPESALANEPAGYAQASPLASPLAHHLQSCSSSDSSPESSPPRRPLRYYSPTHPSSPPHELGARSSLLSQPPAWAGDAPPAEAAFRSDKGLNAVAAAHAPEPGFQPRIAQHSPIDSPIDKHMVSRFSPAPSSPAPSSPAPPPPPPYSLPPPSYGPSCHNPPPYGPSPIAHLPLEPEEDDGGFTWEGWSATGRPIRDQMISNCSAASAAAADLGYCTSGAPLDAASATASSASVANGASGATANGGRWAAAPGAVSLATSGDASSGVSAAAAGATSAAAAGSAPAAVPSTGAPATRSAPRIAYQSPYGDWEGEKQQQSKVRFQGLIAYDAESAGYTKMFQDKQAKKNQGGGLEVHAATGLGGGELAAGAEKGEWNAGIAAALAGLGMASEGMGRGLPPVAAAAGGAAGAGAAHPYASPLAPPPCVSPSVGINPPPGAYTHAAAPGVAHPPAGAAGSGGYGGQYANYAPNPGMYIPQPHAPVGVNGPLHGTHAPDAHGKAGMRQKIGGFFGRFGKK